MAAVLAGGRGATLSHQAAGWLWRIRASGPSWIDVTVTSQRRPRPGLRFHRSAVPRTLLDLAAVIAPDRLERAVHEAEVLRLTDKVSLPELLARYPRRTGAAALRRAAATTPQVTKSELEHRFLHLLKVHRLPRPKTNMLVSGLEVDCAGRTRTSSSNSTAGPCTTPPSPSKQTVSATGC
jgi:hypothetical protein